MRWVYKGSVRTPRGNILDEIKCPVCGYCETRARYTRRARCYICDTVLDADEQFYNQNVRNLSA